MTPTDTDACYRAVRSRDRRFDGVFYTAVTTTGIYCRPSCPAVPPRRSNVRFFRTAAAAQRAGFRACRRCSPDATPGSPEWDLAADAAGRTMRLIADGVVERDGVAGLANRLGYSARHLSRLVAAELGAGPLALARARRAQIARILIETTPLPFSDVAFAAGFASIRQFNDTVREVYASTPSDLRRRRSTRMLEQDAAAEASGRLELRLPVRRPFAGAQLLAFLSQRTISGVEDSGATWYARSLRLPHGTGIVRLALDAERDVGYVRCSAWLADLRDLSATVERCRRLLDADCDPVAVDAQLGADAHLGPLVRRRPGLRVPGCVDGDELAVRAVLGQQVSVPAARRLAGVLADRYGDSLPDEVGTKGAGVASGSHPHETRLQRLFPSAAVLAEVDPGDLPMPRARARALVGLCGALADRRVCLDRSMDRAQVSARLLDLPGIGPWTAGYVAMRALGDPDVLLTTDTGVRASMADLGMAPGDGAAIGAWRPWRSYAQMHLWTHLSALPPESPSTKESP